MDYNELLDSACTHIKNLSVGQIFFVKDLFYGTGWNELERGEKLGFGRYFRKAVAEKTIFGIEYISYTINIQHLLSLVKLLNPRRIHRNVCL